MSELFGCVLTSLSENQALALFAWVRDEGSGIKEAAGTQWLLAHCDDGVVWGKRDDGKWRLSSGPFPDISPEPGVENLQQLRLFGKEKEVLIWRAENGFQGRVLADAEEPEKKELRPKREDQILVGDRLLKGPRDGFSLVGEAGGARHAVPVTCQENDFKKGNRPDWPLRLAVRHYLTQDEDTGTVRIAASRLVDVYNVKKK